jgi:hypothetical protein
MKISAGNIRLGAGLFMLPALLLQNNLTGAVLQVVYIIMLALTHGRQFRIVPNVVILVSVSLAHLMQPNGLRLFTIGNFPITAGALALGARKAFVLIGLLYLSQFMITGKPTFPGKLGKILSLQFYYFERITTGWKDIPKRPFIGALDKLLFSLETVDPVQENMLGNNPTESIKRESILGLLHIVVFWALYVLGRTDFLPTIL